MTNKNLFKYGVIFTVFSLLLIAIKLLLPYPHPEIMLIDVNNVNKDFSSHAKGVQSETQIKQDGLVINFASVTYLSEKEQIRQSIVQFENCEQASNKYLILQDYVIPNGYIISLNLQKEESFATQSQFICYQTTPDSAFQLQSCNYTAQFEVYVVQISSSAIEYSPGNHIKAVINEVERKLLFSKKGCPRDYDS